MKNVTDLYVHLGNALLFLCSLLHTMINEVYGLDLDSVKPPIWKKCKTDPSLRHNQIQYQPAETEKAWIFFSPIWNLDQRSEKIFKINELITSLHLQYLALTNLREADLSGADLRWAYLRGADLSGADLSVTNLLEAKEFDFFFDPSTQFPEGFKEHPSVVIDGNMIRKKRS